MKLNIEELIIMHYIITYSVHVCLSYFPICSIILLHYLNIIIMQTYLKALNI